MIGQQLDTARVRRVVTLVMMDDGTQHGWEVFAPTEIAWSHQGNADDGTLKVRGVFHRMARQGQPQLEIE